MLTNDRRAKQASGRAKRNTAKEARKLSDTPTKVGSTQARIAELLRARPAIYDLRLVRATVDRLIEQGASPVIGPLAVGFAKGFNVNGSAKAKAKITYELEILEDSPFELAVQKVVEHLAADVKELAKIPEPEAISKPQHRKFLETDFQHLLGESFHQWIVECTAPSQTHVRDRSWIAEIKAKGYIDSDLRKLRRYAVGFHRELQKVRSKGALGFCRAFDEVSKVIDRIPKRPLVRPKGDKRYRGLDDLVQELELCVLRAGGKGFGLPSKKQRGRILELLDRLRRHLLELKLATFLPRPGQHPISIYQRAIQDAQADLLLERESLAEIRGARFLILRA